MCGFAGFLDLSRGQPAGALEQQARRMNAVQAHRGPDDDGIFVDETAGIALAHRRLAIRDLSPAGAQPMVSADGRYCLVYNGEIYNAAEIAADLARAGGPGLRGHSDTEILLEAAALWGLEATLQQAIGMFALALWDRRERRLFLARDRMGIKPLYHGRFGRTVLFGSELKALVTHPAFRAELDPESLASYFRLGYVPGPRSIYRHVQKLRPGTVLSVGMDGKEIQTAFWSLRAVAEKGMADPLDIGDEDAIDRLESLAADAVARRMVADVPLGGFLSGGIDSSLVTALMQKASPRPIRSFTIGFEDRAFDEADHARAIASHLGTDHTEMVVRPDDARAVIPDLPDLYDEPFADASAIPTFLLSRLTRGHVTVALSGDGGDELFAGYDRYRVAGMARLSGLPACVRHALGNGLSLLPPGLVDALARPLPSRFVPPMMGDKLAKLARVLQAGDDDGVYQAVRSLWADPEALVPGAREGAQSRPDPELARAFPDFLSRMMYLDAIQYLPDDILVKVDRASMAVGLEARVPLIDHRLVAFAWSLPMRFKRRRGVSKWLLRQLLYRHVPRPLVERPKMGFGVPVGAWLRGPLRDWAESCLARPRLEAEGLLDAALVRQHWEEHLSGRRNWSYRLWAVLMFQCWKARWLP